MQLQGARDEQSRRPDGGQERVREEGNEKTENLLDVVLPFLYSRCRGRRWLLTQGLEKTKSCPVRVICLLAWGGREGCRCFGVCSLARSLSRQSEVSQLGEGDGAIGQTRGMGKAKIFPVQVEMKRPLRYIGIPAAAYKNARVVVYSQVSAHPLDTLPRASRP